MSHENKMFALFFMEMGVCERIELSIYYWMGLVTLDGSNLLKYAIFTANHQARDSN